MTEFEELLRRRALVTLDPTFVVEHLHLPAGTQIIGAEVDTKRGGILTLTVVHASLPECEPGYVPLEVSLQVTSTFKV